MLPVFFTFLNNGNQLKHFIQIVLKYFTLLLSFSFFFFSYQYTLIKTFRCHSNWKNGLVLFCLKMYWYGMLQSASKCFWNLLRNEISQNIYIYMHTERLSKSTKVWFINTHLAPILVIMHWILNCFSVTNTCCFLHKSDSFWGSCSSCWGWDVPKVSKLLWSSNPPEKKWSGPMGYFVPAAECRPEAAFGTLENT